MDLRPRDDQLTFIYSTTRSLAEAYIYAECRPLAVYDDSALIGFVMYALDPDDGQYWIYRFLIDRNHQGAGYGRQTLRELIHLMSREPDCRFILLGVDPANTGAQAFYQACGFYLTGGLCAGELVMRYDLCPNGPVPGKEQP